MIRRHSRPRDRSDERLESLGWKCRIVRLGATATQHVQQSSRARAASPAPPRSSRHSHGDASPSSRRRARWRDRGAARGSRRTPRCAPAWRLRSTALRRDHSHNSSPSSPGSRGRGAVVDHGRSRDARLAGVASFTQLLALPASRRAGSFTGLATAVAPTRTIRAVRRYAGERACRRDRGAAPFGSRVRRASAAPSSLSGRTTTRGSPRSREAPPIPEARGIAGLAAGVAPTRTFEPLAVRHHVGARAGGIDESRAGAPRFRVLRASAATSRPRPRDEWRGEPR